MSETLTSKSATVIRRNMVLFAIGLIALLTYIRGLPNGFVADDYWIRYETQQNFSEYFRYVVDAFRPRFVYFWYNWVLNNLFGANPIGYHLVSLLLHIAVCILVFALAAKLSKDNRIAFVAALLFSIYPRNHQTVMWLTADQIILAVLFGLISILTFIRYLETQKRSWLGLSTLCFLLALFSHESAISLLLLLPLSELYLQINLGSTWKAALKPAFYLKYLPYIAMVVVFFVIYFGRYRAPDAATTTGIGLPETYQFGGLGTQQVRAALGYITYAIIPQIPLRSLDVNAASIGFMILALLILLVLILKGNKLVRYGIIWALISLAPYVILVPSENADRYFYLAAVGLSIAFSTALLATYDYMVHNLNPQFRGAIVALIAAYGLTSFVLIQQRVEEWKIAGELNTQMIHLVLEQNPAPTTDETILLIGLPKAYGQAYALADGIVAAAWMQYATQGIKPKLYQVDDPNLVDYLDIAKPVAHPLENVVSYLYDDGKLIDKSNMIDNIELLNPKSWYN